MDPDAAASARQIAIAISAIEDIARGTMSRLESETRSTVADFRSAPVSRGNFGDVPLAAELADQHHAAHLVFVDTIEGTLRDLRDFQTNLLASAQAHQGTDDAAYATLVSLGGRYQADHTFHSDQRWQQGRRAHGEDLIPDSASEGGTREAPDEAPTTEPQPGDPGPSAPSSGTGL